MKLLYRVSFGLLAILILVTAFTGAEEDSGNESEANATVTETPDADETVTNATVTETPDADELDANATDANATVTEAPETEPPATEAPTTPEPKGCDRDPCQGRGDCVWVRGAEDEDDGFKCYCDPQWTGELCENDKDECQGSPSVCPGTGKECKNKEPGYDCVCAEGFTTLEDGSCEEQLLLDYFGNTTVYIQLDSSKNVTEHALPLSYRMWSRNYHKLQIFRNGYVGFGTMNFGTEVPSQANWRRYQPLQAVYASNIEFGDEGGLWMYEEFYLDGSNPNTALRSFVQVTINEEAFNALYILVLTWDRAMPKDFPQETARFQTVLATDGQFSYTINIYERVWADTELANRPQVTVGRVEQDGGLSSELAAKPGINVNPWFTGQPSNYNAQCFGNIMRVDDDITSKLAALPFCPCLKVQAASDVMFKADESNTDCFMSRFPGSGLSQTCCYTSSGVLIANEADAMAPTLDTKLTTAYTTCCKGSGTLCGEFYSRYPTSKCSRYTPPVYAAGFGDPHLVTLTGYEYTVNGVGEYILLQLEAGGRNLTLQARMKKTDLNQTAFTAYAVKVSGLEESFEVYIKDDEMKSSWSHSNDDDPDALSTAGVSTSKMPEQIIYYLDSIVTVQFFLDPSNTTLHHQVYVHEKNSASGGLMGTMDEAKPLQFRNGTDVVSNLTSAQLNELLESWRVEEEESLFTYKHPTDSTYEAENDETYVASDIPTTVQGVLDAIDEDKKEEASSTCQDDLFCLQTYLVTGSNVSAQDTLETSQAIEQTQIKLDAEPLVVVAPESLNNSLVMVDSVITLAFTLEGDKTADEWSTETSGLDTLPKLTNEGGTFKWNLTGSMVELRSITYPATLTFVAKSGESIGESSPTMVLCLCEHEAECTTDVESVQTGMKDNVIASECTCQSEAKGGRYCTDPIENLCTTCFNQETCNATLEDYCGSCPDGYEGDGFSCRDIDECKSSGCQDECVNTPGGFTCSCSPGYELEQNSKTNCINIDECENTTICDAYPNTFCVDLPGSYSCECEPGKVEKNGVCTFEVELTFVGTVELVETAGQEWSEQLLDSTSDEFKTLANKVEGVIRNQLSATYTDTNEFVVSVLSFEAKYAKTNETRKKREAETEPDSIDSTFAVYFKDANKEVTADDLDNALKKGMADCPGAPCSYGEIVVMDLPSMIPVDMVNLCDYPLNTCKPGATECVMTNNNTAITCECLEGLVPNHLDPNTCDDIDECKTLSDSQCKNCQNTFGSYSCECSDGYYWNDVTVNCTEQMCMNNPCEHDGECVDLQVSPYYSCKCTSKYEGVNCEDEDDDYKRLEIAIICVSVILGVLCIFLIIVLISTCVRHRKSLERQDFHESSSYGYNGLPRPKVKEGVGMSEMGGSSVYDNPESARDGARNSRYAAPENNSRSTNNAYINNAYESEKL